MKTLAAILFTTCVLLHAAPKAEAQRLKFERDLVSSRYCTVTRRQIPFVAGGGTGKVAEVVVSEPHASGLRLHFRHRRVPRPARWKARLYDAADRLVQEYSASPGSDGFWSDEVRGGVARVELHSDFAAQRIDLEIDRVAIMAPPTKPQAITPPDNRVSIQSQSSNVREWGRAVARLRVLGQEHGYYCTAFLVAPDLLMTNYHCAPSADELPSALVDFDYDSANAAPLTVRLKELIVLSKELDLALYRLAETPGQRRPLVLATTRPKNNQALLVIQHPAGEVKQVSLIDCRVNAPQVAGASRKLTDFGHLCDTLGGSSGSAVIDPRTGSVVGLHHLGFEPKSQQLFNRAVHTDLILSFLRRQPGGDPLRKTRPPRRGRGRRTSTGH